MNISPSNDGEPDYPPAHGRFGENAHKRAPQILGGCPISPFQKLKLSCILALLIIFLVLLIILLVL